MTGSPHMTLRRKVRQITAEEMRYFRRAVRAELESYHVPGNHPEDQPTEYKQALVLRELLRKVERLRVLVRTGAW